MLLLYLIWILAILLASASIFGMVVLIFARLFRIRRAKALASCRDAILQALINPNPSEVALRRHVVTTARHGELGPIVLEVLVMVRGAARQAFVARLSEVGAGAALRDRLAHGSVWERIHAAEALAAFAAPEAKDALQRAWGDRDARVRCAALRASIDIGAPPLFDEILLFAGEAGLAYRARALGVVKHMTATAAGEASHALKKPGLSSSIRVALIEALGEAHSVGSVPAVMAVAKDSDVEVRAAAVRALGAIGSPIGFEEIIAALDDAAWTVRARAATAAGQNRLMLAALPLQRHLSDENWRVRLCSAEALRALPTIEHAIV